MREVILLGDKEGAAETARELGIRHVAEVERVVINSSGFAGTNLETQSNGGFVSTNPTTRQEPKILSSFFDTAQKMARHDVVCYVNCDIVLIEDFVAAVRRVATAQKEFLMIGRRWDTDIREPLLFERENWKAELGDRARSQGLHRRDDSLVQQT